MRVIASKGTKCPMEGSPRKYITDSTAVDVPRSVYYLRRLKDGSIVEAGAETPASAVSRGDAETAEKGESESGG
jgi:hypothetical protein